MSRSSDSSGYSHIPVPDRTLVVHPHWAGESTNRESASLLGEAVGLTEAIRLDVVEALVFVVKRHVPKTLIGPGQVETCRKLIADQDIKLTVINASLSPTQQRNLERALSCKVIDRTALILEILGERAQTAEGKLQVELAALNYQKSRLVRSWTHLERQRGGYGFMGGPGESQIETDRRLIAERIIVIKRQLEKVVRTRELHRKTRRDTPYPLVALVGYTNAGKSTLFNRLTNATVMEADMLFATLDPTIRSLTLPGGLEVLLSDTVGFISHLPHELVAAFRATLEEVLEADLLVHVRDISHPETAAQKEDVESVLSELLGEKLNNSRVIEAWNKIDMVEHIHQLPRPEPNHVVMSAHTGDGCEALLYLIEQTLESVLYVTRDYQLDNANGRAIAWLHAHGHIESEIHDEQYARLRVRLSPAEAARFEKQFY